MSKKIADDIKVAEAKPPLKNQQCVVFKLKFDLCDAIMLVILADTFSNALKNTNNLLLENTCDAHNRKKKDIREQFTILNKCRGKFEC